MPDTTWHYAVVVGVDQYPKIDGGKLNLCCPLKDATRVAKWLTSSKGGNLDSSRVRVLTRAVPTGRNPPVPVLDEINDAILECAADFTDRRKLLPNAAERKEAWRKSRFYFYISGHGMDGDGDDAVLITANATRVSMNHISTRKVLNQLKVNRVFGEFVILADCCRELASVEVQDLPWDLTRYAADYIDPDLPRSFVAFASRNRRRAFEPPDCAKAQNSIFTQALLEGLEGGVVGSNVNSKNLESFLFTSVPKLARDQNVPEEQNPQINADPGIIFIQTSKDYEVNLTPQPGSAFAGLASVDALVVEAGVVKSRTALPASHGVFQGRLSTSFYLIVPPGGDPPANGAAVTILQVLGKDTDATIG